MPPPVQGNEGLGPRIYSKTDDDILADGGLAQYDFADPPAGYPNLRPQAQQGRTGGQWRVVEPAGESHRVGREVQMRRELDSRWRLMNRPRYGWIQPAYTKFYGYQYPDYFPLYYGSGPRPDHYYAGFTPKDVILAKTKKRSVTKGAPVGPPRYLIDEQTSGIRKYLSAITAMLFEGYLPSNQEIWSMLENLMYECDSHVRSKSLSDDSRAVLLDLTRLAQITGDFLEQFNSDEKIQRLIHHSILTSRIAADQRQRSQRIRQSMLGVIQETEMGPEEGPSAKSGLRFVNVLVGQRFRNILQEFVDLLREASSYGGQGGSGGSGAMPSNNPEVMGYQGAVYADGGYMESGSRNVVEPKLFEYRRGGTAPSRTTRQFVDQENRMWEEQVFVQQPPIITPSMVKQQPQSQVSADAAGTDFASMLASPLPPDQSYRIMDRLRAILSEIRSEPDLVEAMGMLFGAIADLGRVPSGAGERREMVLGILQDDSNKRDMMIEIASLIEAFSGGQNVSDLIDVIDEFQIAVMEDYVLRDYLNDLTMWLQRSLDPSSAYLESGDFLPKSVDLLQNGRLILGERYPQQINRLLNTANAVFEGFKSNQLLNAFRDAAFAFYRDLLIDPQTNKFTIKASLLHDIRTVYLPVLMRTVRYVPLPIIEFSDANYDFALENVVLAAENIIPSMIEFKVENQVQVSPLPSLPNAYFLNIITLDILQIQADIRNVEFAYRKKTFPRVRDSGLVDILLGGNGLSIHIKVAYDPNLAHTTLVPMEIDCSIDNLIITPHETSRDAMYKIMAPAVVAAIKKRICRSLEENIFNLISRADGMVTASGGGKKKIVGIPLF